MKAFYQVSETQQTWLLICLFIALIMSLLITVLGNHRDRAKRYMSGALLIVLFALLVVLADTFEQITDGNTLKIFFPIPMPILWCIVIGVNILLMAESVLMYRARGRYISRNSIKEAIDRLPSGICYFNMNGTLKLCNLQMDRIFRSLAQKDLQQLSELSEALEGCGSDTGVICLSEDLHNYLFPDGRVWRCQRSVVTDEEGISYTEVVFSDMTELYYKELELKKQTKELKEISRKLKHLSDNVLILTKEREVLAAKTKLHDQMGAGLTAVRQILLNQGTETETAARLLRQAVSAVKNDNEYPPDKDEFEKLIQDAGTVGVKLNVSGELPDNEELSFVFMIAMRECLSNGVRHAGATELWIDMQEDDSSVSLHITNNGTPPKNEVVPKGGLHNLYLYVLDYGGSMNIRSKPSFELTVTLPKVKEDKA